MKGSGKLSLIIILILTAPFIAHAIGSIAPQYDSYIVTSGSMEPEIQTGSLLFTYKTGVENINVGDTITYRERDNFVTHQVINKTNETPPTFTTKGIANDSPDPAQVTEDMIQGKKLFSIPFLGYVIAWAGSTRGFITLVVVPALLLILIELKNIFKELKSRETEIQ